MIGKLIGLGSAATEFGRAVGGVAEVFVGNRAERDAADHERYVRSLAQFGEEFTHPRSSWFDGVVNGLNRLPRPMMAIGTLGLFVYAMAEPHGFATRMQGLAYVPEPLWWLLGAVVSFYFGARELHHYRGRRLDLPLPPPREDRPAALPAPPHDLADAPVPFPAPASAGTAPLPAPPPPAAGAAPAEQPAASPTARATDPDFNAAFEEWRQTARR